MKDLWASYHIQKQAPCMPHWPNGAWSVYNITGEQIAERTVRERVNVEGGYYEGKVIARHSWCGYLGMCETFDGVREMIEKDLQQKQAQAERDKKRSAA